MAWERSSKFRFGSSSWTLWVDRSGKKPKWVVTADREGVSVEPSARGLASKKEALAVLASKIGERIRQLRLDLGLSQEEFASQLGVRAITVSRWERGEQVPTASILKKLSEVVSSRNP